MSGLFGLGGSSFFSVRESQLRPEPATWVRKAWRHHFVCPGPGQAHDRKTSLGSVYQGRGGRDGMFHHLGHASRGRLGTMGSRHSSGADLLLSHYSLVIFLSDEALPRRRCQRSTASNITEARVSTAVQERSVMASTKSRTAVSCRLHARERHAVDNHRGQVDVTRRTRLAVAVAWVDGGCGCESGTHWGSDRPKPSHRDWQAGRGIIRVQQAA